MCMLNPVQELCDNVMPTLQWQFRNKNNYIAKYSS